MTDLVLNIMEVYPQEKVHPEIENPDNSTTVTCGNCGAEVRNVFNLTMRTGENYSVRCSTRNDAGQQCLNIFKVTISEK
ncbi:hypothetical protein [Pseudoalteromonas byunsanensis]|uniref:Uncharacterized protein n=1 Tax=Pseudoalteromonas byunsanensis TaxID=327939 RepID=A0A1S1NC53_9GAMM|nr:hypothetical protein [Pseudoalteromonas byunsanensis]OHU95901.1 hypothetical protein BIW53_08785 [Pseudoalteromonas byunsanensis]